MQICLSTFVILGMLLSACTTDLGARGSQAASGGASGARGSGSAAVIDPADLEAPEPGLPPGEFRIGNAVSPVNYWMTSWMFNDLFKLAGFEAEIGNTEPSVMWAPSIGGEWMIEDRYLVATDDLGWPTSMLLADGRRADGLNALLAGGMEVADAFPPGEYRLLWEGEADIEVWEVDSTEMVGPGEMRVRWNGESILGITVRSIDPENYPRNIRFLRPDAVEGERFNREYLEYLRPFAVIRPLHFFGDQLTYGPAIAWDERKPEEYSHWGGALGAPYEVGIDLANRSDSDLWLNVPIAADDEYIRALAQLTLKELDPERQLYLELGNELWNWSYPYAAGREYALEQARVRWPGFEGSVRSWSGGDPVNELMMLYSWQGARTVEMGEIFRDVWGEEDSRLQLVLAGQIGASLPYWHPSRYLLATPVWVEAESVEPAGYQVDAFAVAPYIHEPEEAPHFSKDSPQEFLEDALVFVRGEGAWNAGSAEPGMRHLIRSDRALAAEYGLPLISYEGGQHFIGSRFTRDEVNPHPLMYDLYRALLEVWQQEGGGLFVHFAGIIPRGQNEPGTEPGYFESENFGIKETQRQPLEEAPKYRAILEVMAGL